MINQHFDNLVSLAGVGLRNKFYRKFISVPLPIQIVTYKWLKLNICFCLSCLNVAYAYIKID
ncbi:hypothetical protein CD113_02355 [Staphylococcus simiae]|nr:hypothetical protein CD113_02355 [Staphylococcus simiae]